MQTQQHVSLHTTAGEREGRMAREGESYGGKVERVRMAAGGRQSNGVGGGG